MACIRSLACEGAAREDEEAELSFNEGLLVGIAEIAEPDGPEADSFAMVGMVHTRFVY